MNLDRAELAGTGAAIVFHAGLIAALSMSLARVATTPEPPSMEVELVEEVGLTAAAPSPAISPPAAQSPEIAESVEPPAPAPRPEPLPPPPKIVPTPKVVPTPAVNAAEKRDTDIKAQPKRQPPLKTAPARPAPEAKAPAKAEPKAEPPAKAEPRTSRLGEDFLKGIGDAPARPAAPAFDASAIASIQQAIRRQIQPCADRQVNPGPGANRIRVTLNLRLSRAGRLVQPPRVVRTTGVDEENERYEDRVKDLAVAAYVGCAPLAGLPPELYQTPEGGWGNINMTYRLP